MATTTKTITRNGRRFVLVPEAEYRRLTQSAEFVPMPPAAKDGTLAALPSVRALIANRIIRARKSVGWSQAELARQAKVNVETLNRIERAKVTADQATISKIEKALQRG
jgi:ribosome-binding protein aMBF1 (putative translation factor)